MSYKITALIPTYRRPKFLHRAILSVLTQTCKDAQVSVFDNASGDTTEDVVKQLSSKYGRVNYHQHLNNIGSLPNFKYAFQSVETPYFSVLSDDDFLAKDFYKNALEILERRLDLMFVITNVLKVDQDANLLVDNASNNQLTFYCTDNRFDALESGDFPTTWTGILFRKEVAQIYIDMYDKDDIGCDKRFMMLAVARYNFAHLSKVGAFFSVHEGSFSVMTEKFDVIYRLVDISRYIEVYHDKETPQFIKDRAMIYAWRLLTANHKPWKRLWNAFKEAIKNICENTNQSLSRGNHEIKNARYSGYKYTSLLLMLLYQNKILRTLVYRLFSNYCARNYKMHQTARVLLQETTYKSLFEDINAISNYSD